MKAIAQLICISGAISSFVAFSEAATPTLPLAVPATGVISAGGDFMIGVRYNGTPRAWGLNEYAQLGVRNSASIILAPTQLKDVSSTPVNLANVAVVSAGGDHGLVVHTGGSLRAAGRNDSGQLGDGTTVNRGGYKVVSGLSGVVGASAGRAHSLALKADGTVWGWGNNEFGQVGNNSTINRLTPQQVTPAAPAYPETFQAVSAGADHSLALRNDGTVWAWGANNHGQLGTGTTTASLVPVQVQNLPANLEVTAIAAGDGFSVVLLSDGTVRGWGRSDFGQLGRGDDASSVVPVEAVGLGASNVAISAGDAHVLVLKSDGTVWGWGGNFSGELGGATPAAQYLPRRIEGLSSVALIDAGSSHSAAVLTDGSILVWGNSNAGVQGAASVGYETVRVQIRDVKSAASIFAGGDQAAVVRSNARAYLFGFNADGQLGNGGLEPVTAPTRLAAWPSSNASAPAFAFGAGHTLGLIEGKVYAAGDNAHGQLGDGTTVSRSGPVLVAGIAGPVTKVAAGWNHSLALRTDGTVLAWGNNDSGQLGIGSVSSAPVSLPASSRD